MGTTPNFSWPYPESSDFVADGATAIENLADAIDTSLYTFPGIVQILSDGVGSSVGNSTATHAASGLSITITPRSATSKFVLIFNLTIGAYPGNSWTSLSFAIRRNGANIRTRNSILYDSSAAGNRIGTWGHVDIDSPATTSPVTYDLTFANHSFATGTVYITTSTGIGFSDSQMWVLEIAS